MTSESSMSSVSDVDSISDINLSSNEDCGEEEIGISRHQRYFRKRNDLFDTLDDGEFRNRFRLTKEAVMYVFNVIKDDVESITRKNNPISAMDQLLIALRFYARGSFNLNMGDHFNVNKCTVNRVVHRISKRIASLRPEYIKMPTNIHERNIINSDFLKMGGIPNVLGAIDGNHIRIQPPEDRNAELFRNKKGCFSINTQIICNANLNIMDVVARNPGSSPDSNVFDNSLIRTRLENQEFGESYLLGDNEYPCRRYLLTPINHPESAAQQKYNQAHINTHGVIERTFSVLKRRFPCLSLGLRLSIDRILSVIVATCVLHNITLMFNDADIRDGNENGMQVNLKSLENAQSQSNDAVRNTLINTVFA